jgi:signal transduction histidine kinase/tetratricopeptide (TPR) repeat protein
MTIDPAAAMSYINRALRLAQQHNWQKGIGLVYLNKARTYGVTSDFAAALDTAGKAYEIFRSVDWKPGMGDALSEIANNYEARGDYSKAIENNFKALGIYEEAGMDRYIAYIYNNLGIDYYRIREYAKAIENYSKALESHKKTNNKYGIASALDNMASVYREQGEFKKANEYNLQAIQLFEEINNEPALGRIYINRGNFLQDQNNFDSALIYYKKAITIATKLGIKRTIAFGNEGIGELCFKLAKNGTRGYIIPGALKMNRAMLLQKAYDHFSTALDLSEKAGELPLMADFTENLSEIEALRGNYKSALDFYQRSAQYKDSIFNKDSERKIAALESERLADVKDKEMQLQSLEHAKKEAEAKRIRNIQYFTIAALGIVVLAVVFIAVIQYRNNKDKQKANALLQQQKTKLEHTLNELRSTQAQLIQSEKMASLGQLTAGIAHEIQNPLNFVNNFSEVNTELIEELKAERLKPKEERNEQAEEDILNDIKGNAHKIIHHGKRADAIVKNMLQHSRTRTGNKEPTDINELADEYLRLSYQGIRAKDKSLSTGNPGYPATLQTDFDPGIGTIDVICQDIGRVLLNLYNNAFYAVQEKRKRVHDDDYNPTVSVSTKKADGKIEIHVKDNGTGIPQDILDKIFQPFFTTKQPGSGTGLGLSLSYDMIKANGGDILVKTKEGEGSEFIVQLPVKDYDEMNTSA